MGSQTPRSTHHTIAIIAVCSATISKHSFRRMVHNINVLIIYMQQTTHFKYAGVKKSQNDFIHLSCIIYKLLLLAENLSTGTLLKMGPSHRPEIEEFFLWIQHPRKIMCKYVPF